MASLVSPTFREHVMLLYDSDDERNAAAAHYINEGLKSGQLCVYASVGALDSTSKRHTSQISSSIVDYEDNVNRDNLVVVDFKPFFESAQKSEFGLFLQLKARLEEMLKQRIADGKGDRMLVFADAACTLSENGEFDECVALESWWQNAYYEWRSNNQNITVICPHPSKVLDVHSKGRIANVHSLMIRLKHFKSSPKSDDTCIIAKQGRVLIAESNADMKYLYSRYLGKMRFDVTIVDSDSECLDRVFNVGDAGFDIVILDGHFGEDWIETIRKIRERWPDQRIILTTTSLIERDKSELGVQVITKPFSLSKLLKLITSKAIN